jgi:hypothetical protein
MLLLEVAGMTLLILLDFVLIIVAHLLGMLCLDQSLKVLLAKLLL